MSATFHCPYRQSTLLQQALAPDKMRIAFLLGAGCPVSIRTPNGASTEPLIPDIRGLTTLVNQRLAADPKYAKSHAAVLKRFADGDSHGDPTVEDILSHIRTLQDVVRAGSIDGLDKAMLIALDTAICNITTEVVGVPLPASATPYHQLVFRR